MGSVGAEGRFDDLDTAELIDSLKITYPVKDTDQLLERLLSDKRVDLVPVNPDHRFPWLGHSRLYQVPVRLGYLERAADPAELNPLPHPFS